MLDMINQSDMEALSMKRDGWRVSVYMPTHQAGDQVQQDPIRLKNLLDRAEERLVEKGLRRPEAEELVAPARLLLEDNLFWKHQSDGLAVFVSGEGLDYYRMPFDFEEQVIVGERFYVKPLLPLLSGDGRFYVLALSQDQVRLLAGTRYAAGEVDLESVPDSLAEALRFDDPERRLQFHTATGPSGGKGERPAAFHGHGGADVDEKEAILRYFQKLDNELAPYLADVQVPMVLAGVDYLLPLYREANSYQHLVDEGIEGNPEELSVRELHHRAWAVVAPHFQQEQEEARRLYGDLTGTDRQSDDLEEIVAASHYGRVETLWVALGQERWGTFDPQANEMEVHDEHEPGDEDLLGAAAVQTLLNSGAVYAVEAAQVPGDGPLAAIFRY